eukprot:TRINITY_DN6961_c0_g1_i1.p1 TRINITY_DN6961_c0_g1~~TRINITY_DN6961_c0_g1_i1.p1  ORF type:complete len:110 (-),score=23.22 TRINITY_DN6961_c0_g1_i1:5-334(-)
MKLAHMVVKAMKSYEEKLIKEKHAATSEVSPPSSTVGPSASTSGRSVTLEEIFAAARNNLPPSTLPSPSPLPPTLFTPSLESPYHQSSASTLASRITPSLNHLHTRTLR